MKEKEPTAAEVRNVMAALGRRRSKAKTIAARANAKRSWVSRKQAKKGGK